MPVLPDDPAVVVAPVLSVNEMAKAGHETWLLMGRSTSPFYRPWPHLPPMARATISRQCVALYAMLAASKLLAPGVVFKDEYLDLMAGKHQGWVDPEAENLPKSDLDTVAREVHNQWVDSGDRTAHELGNAWDGLKDTQKSRVRMVVTQLANEAIIGGTSMGVNDLVASYAQRMGGKVMSGTAKPSLKLAGDDEAPEQPEKNEEKPPLKPAA